MSSCFSSCWGRPSWRWSPCLGLASRLFGGPPLPPLSTWTWDLGYQVKDRKGSKERGLRCWTCVSPPRRQAGEEQPGGAGGKKWFWAAHQVPEQRGNCEVMVSCEYWLDHIIGKHGVKFWIGLKYLQGAYLVSSMDELWEREKRKNIEHKLFILKIV